MASLSELTALVNAAFAQASPQHPSWPDPHPRRSPTDDEYSRLTNPDRWRIAGARADAWLSAITQLELAAVGPANPDLWATPPGPVLTRTDLVVPHARGALPMLIARGRLGDIPDAGVTVGVGDPAALVVSVPDCGRDACDSGSRDALDELDAHILGVLTGAFRRLTNRTREITVIGDGGWSGSGLHRRDDVTAILANSAGWSELSGTIWL